MKTKKTFKKSELTEGMCFKCGEYTDKIIKKDGRCVKCYNEDEYEDDKTRK